MGESLCALPFIGPYCVLRFAEVLPGILWAVDVVVGHEHLGSVLSVWVATWGKGSVVRYLASRDVCGFSTLVSTKDPRGYSWGRKAELVGMDCVVWVGYSVLWLVYAALSVLPLLSASRNRVTTTLTVPS